MILDKTKQLHKDYGGMSDKDCSTLGFTPRVENIEALKQLLRDGKWSSLSFSMLEELDLSAALRIMPHMPGMNWPVYYLYPDGQFYASDIRSYILFVHIERLIEDRDLCEDYLKQWQDIYEVIMPVYKLFGGEDDLQDIRDIVFDKAKWPKANEDRDTLLTKYRAFCLKRDSAYASQYLWQFLDRLIQSQDFLPDIPNVELGIYGPRIVKLIAKRAFKLFSKLDYPVLEKALLFGFKEPNGYDIADIHPDYYPSMPVGEKSDMELMVEGIFKSSKILSGSPVIQVIPEYKVAKALFEQGSGGFTGMEFMEAAAILDEEHNQPLRAWNCLVSAGYWAGQNLPDAQETIVKAAIYLCEKHNWLEAAEVLKYNLTIMQSA